MSWTKTALNSEVLSVIYRLPGCRKKSLRECECPFKFAIKKSSRLKNGKISLATVDEQSYDE